MIKTALVGILILGFFLPLFAQESSEQAQTQPEQETQPVAESKPAVSGDFGAGMKHYRLRHYGRAVEEFQRVIDSGSSDAAAAYYFMGYAHYVMGHHQEALAAFKKCFETDSKFDPRPYWRR